MTTEEIKQLVIAKANQYGISPGIALAQMARESDNFRQDVIFGPFVGGAGERGISQFTPATWGTYGSGPHTNAYDPNLALDAWGHYMTALLGMFGGDYVKALTGYNGGPGHLTNPGKYGPPSQAAINYAQAIYSQAGAMADSQAGNQPGAGSSSFPLWLALGAGALLLWFALSD